MATFTESQISSLAGIFEVPSDTLSEWIGYSAALVTESDKTNVLAKITEWETIGSDFTKIHPMERNFGAEINPSDSKATLKRQVAAWLHITELLADYGGGSGGSRLTRC